VNALTPFLVILAGMAAMMLAAWLTQRAVRNGGWVDVFWTFGTGTACVAAAMWPEPAANGMRQLLVAGLSAVWALRLGGYVAYRVATSSEDTRYAGLREEWGAKFQANMFWLVIVQAPATAILALSVFAAGHAGAAQLGLRDALGAIVLLVAIAGEGLADEQMRRFKRQGHHGAIMDKGLWGWSRHPNYFFEWFGWLAYPVIAFDPVEPWTWTTWIAPVVMFVILRFGTGVPALEKTMLQRRGDKFRDYQKRVGAFFPLPPKGKPS
jgi:steroid 5-alpha reductase family enzyme